MYFPPCVVRVLILTREVDRFEFRLWNLIIRLGVYQFTELFFVLWALALR